MSRNTNSFYFFVSNILKEFGARLRRLRIFIKKMGKKYLLMIRDSKLKNKGFKRIPDEFVPIDISKKQNGEYELTSLFA